MSTHRAWRLLAIGCLFAGACSVLNGYDDVLPRIEGEGGMDTSSGGSSSAGQGGTGGTTATGGSGNGGEPMQGGGGAVGEAGSGGESPSTGGATVGGGGSGGEAVGGGGAAGDTGVRPVPTSGLIVAGGTELDGITGLISVLDPANGEELRREQLATSAQVAGIAYDGAEGRDVWFVFLGSDFPAKEDKVVNLQVRYFDDRANTWSIISRVTTLPPPVPGSFAVLNARLAYLSHTVQAGKVTPSLTILDTSDLQDVKIVSYEPPATEGEMELLLGTRGTADDRNGLGGTLDLVLGQNCGTTTCELFVQPIAVGNAVTNGVGHAIGSYRGAVVGAASTRNLDDYFAFAPATGSVVVSRIAPDAPEAPSTSNAPPSATDLRGLVLAECQDVVAFTAYDEAAIYAVTSAGIGKTWDLGRPGDLVAYEPFSKDVITSYNPKGDVGTGGAGGAGGAESVPDITAVRVTSTSSSNLSLASRPATAWDPPDDIRVNVLATRIPYPLTCQ